MPFPHKLKSIILRKDRTGYFRNKATKENYVNLEGKDIEASFETRDIWLFDWPRWSIGHKTKPTVLLMEGNSKAIALKFLDGQEGNVAAFIPPLTQKENAEMIKRLNTLARIGRALSNPIVIALICMVAANLVMVLMLLFGLHLSISSSGMPQITNSTAVGR